jgi:hypothetical protein
VLDALLAEKTPRWVGGSEVGSETPVASVMNFKLAEEDNGKKGVLRGL